MPNLSKAEYDRRIALGWQRVYDCGGWFWKIPSKCGKCGIDILVFTRNKRDINYCSNSCAASGKNNPKDKGGILKDKAAYKRMRRTLEHVMEADKVRNATNWLIRSGQLIRGKCLVCNSPNAEAHHKSDDPLDILWLCQRHHRDLHCGRKTKGVDYEQSTQPTAPASSY